MRGWLLLPLLSLAAPAWAQDYRLFTLTDGRAFPGDLLSSGDTGMHVRVRQGEIVIPYDQLRDMIPTDMNRYTEAEPWVVWLVAPDAWRSTTYLAVHKVPGVQVFGERGTEGVATRDQVQTARSCEADVACIIKAFTGTRWFWVVSVREDADELVLDGTVSTGLSHTEVRVRRDDPEALNRGVAEILGLKVAAASPTGRVETPTVDAVETPEDVGHRTKPTKAERMRMAEEARNAAGDERGEVPPAAWAFVPIPGMPSMRLRDGVGVGLAFATITPLTAGWVALAGKATSSVPEHVVLSLGGYYVATVAVNQIFGARSLARQGVAVSVGPSRKGRGALLTVAATW